MWSTRPPGIPVLKVKNSPPPAVKIPENSSCQKHYIFVVYYYLSILDLYWRYVFTLLFTRLLQAGSDVILDFPLMLLYILLL